jgi:hypothetical protein
MLDLLILDTFTAPRTNRLSLFSNLPLFVTPLAWYVSVRTGQQPVIVYWAKALQEVWVVTMRGLAGRTHWW